MVNLWAGTADKTLPFTEISKGEEATKSKTTVAHMDGCCSSFSGCCVVKDEGVGNVGVTAGLAATAHVYLAWPAHPDNTYL
jgi:hypothetical protein